MALTAKKVYAILKRQISDMEAKLNSPVRYRGTVVTADLLPLNPDIGDMYNIESKSVYGEAGMNVAWNGVVWDTMGAPIDMSLYLTKEEAELVIQRLVTEYLEKNPVKPGATAEQAQQIEQNKTDIASLKTETGSLKNECLTGNASTATKLQTIRKINGTDFDGSSDITTTNWGTARNITIGNTKKSANGSADISWSLTEIGASASDHTHKYAGSSSVAGAANSAVKLTTARMINGTSFDGSSDITTAKWGTSRDITIGNKKKPLDGSATVAWSLNEIGAAAIGHKHTKSEITDFPDSLKNPKGIRFLLPAYHDDGNLYWITNYDNALKPGSNSDYKIVENDRIIGGFDSGRQINYYGDTTPMINLAKLYQGGGVNYLTHTTSMKFCLEGGGHDEINIWGDDLNWNILVYNGLNEVYDGACLHFEEGSQSGNELYFKEQPDYIIASTISPSGYDDSKESKIIFHLKKNAFKEYDGNSRMPYTFSFEVANYSYIYGPNSGNNECGIKIFNDEDNEETDMPMYQEIWGRGQQIELLQDSRISVSFVPQITRNDPASQGVKIIIYGGDMQLCIRRPQLECGNIPSDWRPNIEELADGTYKSELDEMRSKYTIKY